MEGSASCPGDALSDSRPPGRRLRPFRGWGASWGKRARACPSLPQCPHPRPGELPFGSALCLRISLAWDGKSVYFMTTSLCSVERTLKTRLLI